MADRISYATKELGASSSYPTNKKWRFQDANDVKAVVNTHADDIESLETLSNSSLVTKTAITNNYNLPSASGFNGVLVLYNRSGSTWTLTCNGSDTFEGLATQTIQNNETFEMRVDNTLTNWFI